VFIRSMATRGHLGGLSAATPMALRVLSAAGYDVILVETVGVGQSEVEVAGTADTTLVLLAPGMGDGIQAAKAGILEIADILVVNKADRDGADSTAREMRQMLTLVDRGSDEWRPPVEKLIAATGQGLDTLLKRIAEHREWGERTGAVQERRIKRAANEVEALAPNCSMNSHGRSHSPRSTSTRPQINSWRRSSPEPFGRIVRIAPHKGHAPNQND